MSSSGRMREITPLLPWRPAILSPTDSLRLMATYTLTILNTPGGSSSPFLSRAIFSSKTVLITFACSSTLAKMRSTLLLTFPSVTWMSLHLRVGIAARASPVMTSPASNQVCFRRSS